MKTDLQFGSPLESQVCGNPSDAKDMRTSIYIVSGIAIALVILLVGFFKPIYKRMNAEKGAALIDAEGGKLIAIESVTSEINGPPPETNPSV